jgi:protein O-mannosyl-transferase
VITKHHEKQVKLLIYIGLAAVTFAAYEPTLHNGFVNYDDNLYITENPHITGGITTDSVIWALTQPHDYMWHPLTTLSHMLDCQLFGLNAPRHHFVSLLFHITNALLIFWIFTNLTDSTSSPQAGTIWPSAFIAAVFALHPIQVESVAWAAERKTVLSGLFWFLTISVYIWYAKRPAIGRYILLFAVFGLCIMTKPIVVTLPFALLLLDYWPLERTGGRKTEGRRQNTEYVKQKTSLKWLIIEKIPFITLSVVLSVITFLASMKNNVVIQINALPLKDRAANVFLSYIRYIGKLFWPRNLAVFYPFDANSFAFWQVAMCVLLFLVITIFVIRFGRNRKYLPVGWFWFVGTLVPVIGLVQAGLQALADRYAYISYIGLFIMIAWGLPELLSNWPRRKIALGLSMVIALSTLGICTHRQVSFWNNSDSLFSHAIEVTQNNYVAYGHRGVAYTNLGRHQEAIENLSQAIRIAPDYAEAYYNRGVAYSRLGRWQEAMESYKQAIRIKPDDALAHGNIGAAYGNLGRRQDAIESFKQAVRIKPDFVLAHYNLGAAYLVAGDKGAALEEYKILKTLDTEKANELIKLIGK